MSSITKQDFLGLRRVWISTSSDADIVVANRVRILVLELCRYIFAANGTIAYGGDLRRNGITFSFYEAAFRHFPKEDQRRSALLHVLPEAGYAKIAATELRQLVQEIAPIGSIILIDQQGTNVTPSYVKRHSVSKEAADKSLRHMRELLATQCDAMIAFAGREVPKRDQSGVTKEVLLFGETKKPLYVLGGFGGVCKEMLAERSLQKPNDGLSVAERELLHSSAHIPEVVGLILKGLRQRLS